MVQAAAAGNRVERRMLTTSAGTSEFDSLEPGNYDVRVESAGFGVSLQRISLDVGATLRVNIRLSLTGHAETVDISSSALSIAEAIPTDVLTHTTIETLPINGRRFQDSASLSPAIQALTETHVQLSVVRE